MDCFLYTFRECKNWGQASLCDIGQVALPLWAALFSPGQGLTSLTASLVDLDGGYVCVTPSQAPALGSFWLNSGPLCVPLSCVSPPS